MPKKVATKRKATTRKATLVKSKQRVSKPRIILVHSVQKGGGGMGDLVSSMASLGSALGAWKRS